MNAVAENAEYFAKNVMGLGTIRPNGRSSSPSAHFAALFPSILMGLSRYDEFQSSTGVTNAILSDRLKLIEKNGPIERRRYQTKPDRYESLLTDIGRDAALVIQALVQLGDIWNLAGPPPRFVSARLGEAVSLLRLTGYRRYPSMLRICASKRGRALTIS